MRTSDLAQQLLAALPRGEVPAPPSPFFAVPGDAPRWLIPADGRALHSTLSSWSPYRLLSRLKWRAIRVANRMGALQALPNVKLLELVNGNEVDWYAVGWNRAAPPVTLIYVGTPGPRQKAIIYLVDPASGNCDAIVKVPLCAGAMDTIVRDAGVLSVLADRDFTCAPRLLHVDRQRGISAQEFLPGKSGCRHFRPEYWSLLGSLVLPDEHTNIAAHATRWRQPIPSTLHGTDPDLMRAALSELDDHYLLPACWVHGDFAPWNIRHCRSSTPALIDWEESELGGLPLQDAYHFLHMQDFLFGASPTAHCADVEPFAKTLGIAPTQCRKLEVAYLVRSHVQCAPHHQPQRAEFLRKTLALLVRDRVASHIVPTKPLRSLHLVSSHPVNLHGARAQLFDTLVAQLNRTQVPYCILSGYEAVSETSASDVDIMFRPRDLQYVPGLLARAAQTAGASLVQAIQHETTACYFVIAHHQGKHIVHLSADCYSDYCRDGRTWLLAENVIADRSKHREFYVPAVADEFIYYLIKKVLKQDITSYQLKRLQHLFARSPTDCHARIAGTWPAKSSLVLQRAIVEQNLACFQSQLSNLLMELQGTPMLQHRLCRTVQDLRELERGLRRVVFPTGLSVMVVGGSSALRLELADRLACDLAPVFRRTRRASLANRLPGSFRQMLETWVARVRSTLVVLSADDSPAVNGSWQARRWFESVAARVLTRPGLILSLGSAQSDNAGHARGLRQDLICLNADSLPEQLLQDASRAILGRLAMRTETRLKLRTVIPTSVVNTASTRSELHSAGLD